MDRIIPLSRDFRAIAHREAGKVVALSIDDIARRPGPFRITLGPREILALKRALAIIGPDVDQGDERPLLPAFDDLGLAGQLDHLRVHHGIGQVLLEMERLRAHQAAHETVCSHDHADQEG